MALAGCDCSELSGPATLPCAPISASQVSPSSSALALLITTTAQAPSEIGEAVPAVMVPSLRNAGRSLASDFRRGVRPDALVVADHDRVALPLRQLTGAISSANTPFFCAGGRPLVAARRERVLLLPARSRASALCCSVDSPIETWSYASVRPSSAMWSTTVTSPYL